MYNYICVYLFLHIYVYVSNIFIFVSVYEYYCLSFLVACTGVAYLNPDPKTNTGVIEVIRGASQTLRCQFFCAKGVSREIWRNGKGELLGTEDDPNYMVTPYDRPDDKNIFAPDHIAILTIVNFTKSENITCIRKQNGHLINTTFHLVPKGG